MLKFIFSLLVALAAINTTYTMDNKPKKRMVRSPSKILKKHIIPRAQSAPTVESPRVPVSVRSKSEEKIYLAVPPLNLSLVHPDQQPIQRSRNRNFLPLQKVMFGDLPPLIFLVKEGDIDALKQAIASTCYDINEQDQLGETALSWAIRKQDRCMIKHLLKQPTIDINKQNKSGNTALHYAVLLGNIEIVQSLLACTTLMPNIQNLDGFTPAHCTAQCIKDEHDSHAKIMLYLIGDPRVTFNIGTGENGHVTKNNNLPHELIARKQTDERIAFRKSIFSRYTLDFTLDKLLEDLLKIKTILFKIPHENICLTQDDVDENLENIIEEVKLKTRDCWIDGNYINDDFIKTMILARCKGIAKIRPTQTYH